MLSLAAVKSYYAASSSAPSNAIHFFDKSNLQSVGQVAGHDDTITTMRAVSNFAGTPHGTLVSCGKDGCVKIWDERAGSAAVQSE